MLRFLGRRRNSYLYLVVCLIFILALFQSAIFDLFKQTLPSGNCDDVGMCHRVTWKTRAHSLGVNLSHDNGTRFGAISAGSAAFITDPGHVGNRSTSASKIGLRERNTTTFHGNHSMLRKSDLARSQGMGIPVVTMTTASAGTIPLGRLSWTKDAGVNQKQSSDTRIPRWQKKLVNNVRNPRRPSKYYLVEVLQVRIYADDKAKWTIKELKQWMHYLFLAGVEHIYVCDHHQWDSESLYSLLSRYISLNLVTYIPWRDIKHPMTAQVECYQYVIDEYGNRTKFQMAIDMDEYPFSFQDFGEGFLCRFLNNVTSLGYGHRISEISMNNYLMLGQGDRTQDMAIARINRMTPEPANHLVKPIFRPERVRAGIHHNYLRRGTAIYAEDMQLRMLHYWGARLQDWGPDTQKVLDMTSVMNTMRDKWAPRVRNSLKSFGEMDAFSKVTGP